ncbi:MAG TPA: HAD family hydrolase [Bacteroidales bacterium]|nr:HAD family hydrolase [Bacteroidales bacterium]
MKTSEGIGGPGFKVLATDLDGTILDSRGRLSEENLEALHELGRRGICRVLATGRSIFSLKRALSGLLPVDYIVFSTGAGILEVESGDLIWRKGLDQVDAGRIAAYFMDRDISFMVHHPVPENHRFHVYRADTALHPDFLRRMEFYKGFWEWWDEEKTDMAGAAQFLTILEPSVSAFNGLAAGLKAFKVIRTTSPIDHRSFWMEVFPHGVSKGDALHFLMRRLGVGAHELVAMGNDYNDLDMLEVARRAYVTGNAAIELQSQFTVIPCNDDHALDWLVRNVSM